MTTRQKILISLSFVNGFVLMVFELVAARLLAPTIGSSMYIWTSVIGVIIAMLSLGVWVGGRVADRRNTFSDTAFALLGAAMCVVSVLTMSPDVLRWLAAESLDPRLKGVIASLLLFAPTSLVLGFVGPYLAKLNVRSLKATGRSIANLDAMHALGGIVGTFLTGFLLFSLVGSKTILAILAVLLLVASWAVVPRERIRIRLIVSAVIIGTMVVSIMSWQQTKSTISLDTATAHYTISEQQTTMSHMRFLSTGPSGMQSGIDLDSPQTPVFWYAQQIEYVASTLASHNTILILGGGAFTLPSQFAKQYPHSHIDVVEIDPELPTIARDYFLYSDPANVTVVSGDARTYIDSTNKKYDIVIVDVYNDTEVPFTILTKEYGDAIRRVTNTDGTVIANIITGDTTACRKFLQMSFKPYTDHFGHGYYRQNGTALRTVTNLIAVFSDARPSLGDNYTPTTVSRTTPLYTDDFAPSEAMQYSCLAQI